MRIALLSNVTVEVLAGMLRDGGHAVWVPSGFGAWMETALAPPPGLATFAPDTIAVLLDARFAHDDARARLDAARTALAAAFPDAAVVAPDLSALFADLGELAYDERLWTLAKMPWSMDALLELKKLLALPKKVLALDLDNTLWQGVVSEDGAANVVPNAALQREALALKGRGVLLVALSKNNAADIEPVWDDPRMSLRRDDFAALRVNWDAKSLNLSDVARELNLGTDAFVFVDDDPGNRAEMRAALGDVAVAAFPPDLSLYFPPRALTEEDRSRTELYHAESRRRDLAARLSYDDYLRSLAICTDAHEMASAEIPRVAQLAQKTNQFNVNAHRWTEDDVRAFASDPARLVVTLRASDRFGDLGLVGFVHARLDGADGAEIVDWVMSCRAMNRRIEFALEAEVERLLAQRGVRRVAATYVATAKNAPVERLFDGFGYQLVAAAAGRRTYERRL